MTIKDLIRNPFGPYPDSKILSPTVKFPRKGELFHLASFEMDCDSKPIGFDKSEIQRTPTSQNVIHHPVYFFGILIIESLLWLSPLGREWLESDLQQRDIEQHFHKRYNPVSKLTLQGLYGENKEGGFRIKVYIQGEKNMYALYKTVKAMPFSLIVTSRDQDRKYEIMSMNVKAYSLSRNFLIRYQLLSLMEEIKLQDPDTPVEDRTITYFIDQYLTKFSFTSWDLHHRIISGLDDLNEAITIPRHPRHIPQAEIISAFAAQAEWILADQLNKMADKRVLDVIKWESFCRQVKLGRREVKIVNGRQWGQCYNAESEGDNDSDDDNDPVNLTKFGISPSKFQKQMKAARKKNTKPSPKEPTPISEDYEEEGLFRQPRPPKHVYDSDFSELSTPSASDSEKDSDPDPELLGLLHPCFFRAPLLPDKGMTWYCPIPHCTWSIDLLNLTDNNVEGLSSGDVLSLTRKQWLNVKEEAVSTGFYQMVSNHYLEHLKEVGIQVAGADTDKHQVEWIQPNWHRKWPPLHPQTHQIPDIKDEEY